VSAKSIIVPNVYKCLHQESAVPELFIDSGACCNTPLPETPELPSRKSKMTGISDVVRSVRSVKRFVLSFCQQFLTFLVSFLPFAWSSPLHPYLASISDVPLPHAPKPMLGYFQEKEDACNPFHVDIRERLSAIVDPSADEIHLWGLLVPVCCREGSTEECFSRLVSLVKSIEVTLEVEERVQLMIFLGVDQFDIFYDKDDTKARVIELFTSIGIPGQSVRVVMLRSHYRGKLCRIWDTLACEAVNAGCCFVTLLGDDVRFLTRGWKAEVEKHFADISNRRQLPYGTGCVAFRDVTFPVFPTFPVIHRSHFRIFGYLLPAVFINQHDDPFLFELYRRIGTAEFASVAALENTIGGAGDARYAKHNFQWQNDVLSVAVLKLFGTLDRKSHEFRCLDVVVPTYRCDLNILKEITALVARHGQASVNFVIVVDNPSAPNLLDLAVLEDWSRNHLVRVARNTVNMGASASRNTGIATSCGDWIILLDDDVLPDLDLLDAYLGAIERHPTAKVLVGLTKLPKPETWLQHALMASQMTFFYDVALRMKNPPWGVTANLCIQGRTCKRVVWFSEMYPRTGGGEDVDFCLRLKDLLPAKDRTEAVVAVPEALAHHPFWANVTQQVVGWALGDVKCLSALPSRAFYAPPNWLELIFLLAMYKALTSSFLSLQYIQVAFLIILLEVALTGIVSLSRVSQSIPMWKRALIAPAAAFPIMVQDFARLLSKLLRFQLGHICLQLDWMDGQRDHVADTRYVLVIKNAASFLIVVASLYPTFLARITIYGLCLLIGAFFLWWSNSQHFSPEHETQTQMSYLRPLPVDLPPGHPQPFVILAFQRTGSNLLCGRLHNHSHVVMHNEVFNFSKIWTYQNEDVRSDPSWSWNIFSRDSDPVAFICDLFIREPLKKKNWQAVGFKLFPDHWSDSNTCALQQLLGDARVKKIILHRENVLDVYISKLRADKTGYYISKKLDDIRVDVDLAAFAAFVDYYEACYKFYDDCVVGQQVHRVTYDQLADPVGGDDAVQKILSFLGIECSGAAPPKLDVTVKQTARPLCEGIVNYEEVKLAFRRHPKVKAYLKQPNDGDTHLQA